MIGTNKEGDGLIFGSQLRFYIPTRGTDAFCPVAHEPVHVILSLPDIDNALQHGVAFGVVRNSRYPKMLNEVRRMELVVDSVDAEDNREKLFFTFERVQRDGCVVAGMKPEVEPQIGLSRGDYAREILPGITRFENGDI